MLLPIRVDRPNRRPTRVTYALMALNLLVFAVQLTAPRFTEPFVLARDVTPIYTYLTYAFLHGGVTHILGNLLILWVFGPAVEDRFGRLPFLGFYLAGGVVAGVAHTLFSPSGVVGASGAIAGVTGAFLALFPRARVRALWLLGIITVLFVPGWFFIGLAIARDLLQVGLGGERRVANEAHLGGYLYGFSIAMTLLALRAIPREPYDLVSAFTQAGRRRAIREAAAERERDQRKRLAPEREDDPDAADIAERRAAVTTALAESRSGDAAEAYRDLVQTYGAQRPAAATLSRRAQLEIAGELYRRGEHDLADFAFARFVDAFPADPEAAPSRILLARIKARYTNQPGAAAAILRAVIPTLDDDDLRRTAQQDLDAINAAGA